MSDPADSVQRLYASFASGDIPAVLNALAPDVTWVEAEGFPYGGTYSGRDAVLENVFMKLGSEWEDFAAQPEELVAQGGTVVALGQYSGTYRATGKSFSAPFVHVWKFGDDGKVVNFHQHTDTAVVQRALA